MRRLFESQEVGLKVCNCRGDSCCDEGNWEDKLFRTKRGFPVVGLGAAAPPVESVARLSELMNEIASVCVEKVHISAHFENTSLRFICHKWFEFTEGRRIGDWCFISGELAGELAFRFSVKTKSGSLAFSKCKRELEQADSICVWPVTKCSEQKYEFRSTSFASTVGRVC